MSESESAEMHQDEGSQAPLNSAESGGTPVVVPEIDWDNSTGDPLVEVRKGYGISQVGGKGTAGPVPPPENKGSEQAED